MRTEARQPTVPEALPAPPDELLASVRTGDLARDRWTHEAHLAVAWALNRHRHGPAITLGELRGLITAYNAVSGLPASRVICHETITVYYLGAVVALDAPTVDALYRHPWCERDAPLRHWRTETLASHAARRSCVDPDLEPLPFELALDQHHHATPDPRS